MPETPNTVTNATREQLCGSSQSYKSLLPLYRDVEVAVIILLSENTIICLFVTKHSHFLPQCKQTFIKNLQISFYFRHCKLCIFFFFFQTIYCTDIAFQVARNGTHAQYSPFFYIYMKTYNLEVCGQTGIILGVQSLVRVSS